MKNKVKSRIKFLIALTGIIMLMGSCEYKEVADTDWPDQLIYMPAALYNPFTINSVPSAIGSSPTPGFPVRFLTDTVARKFNVLLGVYRSGVNNDGTFKVNVAVKTDTIAYLIAKATLPANAVLLPSDKYTFPSEVTINSGSDLAKIDLLVDLDFLRTNSPAGIYAIALGISSTARKTNPALANTIVLIDTKFMKPTALFTNLASVSDPRTINFTNTSTNGTKFIWDFGDGSVPKITTNAKNEAVSHTYAAAKTYTVKLTVVGVTDWADKNVFTKVITVL